MFVIRRAVACLGEISAATPRIDCPIGHLTADNRSVCRSSLAAQRTQMTALYLDHQQRLHSFPSGRQLDAA